MSVSEAAAKKSLKRLILRKENPELKLRGVWVHRRRLFQDFSIGFYVRRKKVNEVIGQFEKERRHFGSLTNEFAISRWWYCFE